MTRIPLSEAREGDFIETARGGPREIALVDGVWLYLPSVRRPRDVVAYQRSKLAQRGVTHAVRPQEGMS